MYPINYSKDIEKQKIIFNRSQELYNIIHNFKFVAERMQISYEKLMYIRRKIKGEM